MAQRWEYKIFKFQIDDVFKLPQEEAIAKTNVFMNSFGMEGWEVFYTNAAVLGNTQHLIYSCKRPY